MVLALSQNESKPWTKLTGVLEASFCKLLWIHGSIKANPNLAETQQNIRFCVDHVSIKVPLPRLKMLKSKYEQSSHMFAFQCVQRLPTSSNIFQLANVHSLCMSLHAFASDSSRLLQSAKPETDLSNIALKPLIESPEAIVGPKFLVSGHTAHPCCAASSASSFQGSHLVCMSWQRRQHVEIEDLFVLLASIHRIMYDHSRCTQAGMSIQWLCTHPSFTHSIITNKSHHLTSSRFFRRRADGFFVSSHSKWSQHQVFFGSDQANCQLFQAALPEQKSCRKVLQYPRQYQDVQRFAFCHFYCNMCSGGNLQSSKSQLLFKQNSDLFTLGSKTISEFLGKNGKRQS